MNRIGRLFILVEGERDDARYLSKFFRKIFNLSVVTDSKRYLYLNQHAESNYEILVKDNAENIVIIKAAPKNVLHSALKELDEYDVIPKIYNILDSHLFNTVLIFDKDIECGNTNEKIEKYLIKFNNPLDSGLLLVSYPCIESLLLSCKSNTKEYFANSKIAKRNWKNHPNKELLFSDLLIGVSYSLQILSEYGYSQNIDQLLLKLNDIDLTIEQDYNQHNQWIKLSLVSLLFIALGIIE